MTPLSVIISNWYISIAWWLHYLLLYQIDISHWLMTPLSVIVSNWYISIAWQLHYLISISSSIWYCNGYQWDLFVSLFDTFTLFFHLISLWYSLSLTLQILDISTSWPLYMCEYDALPILSRPNITWKVMMSVSHCSFHNPGNVWLVFFFFGCFFISTLWYLHCLMLQLSVIATERPLSCLSVISTDSTITFVLCQLSTYDFIT